MFMDNKALLDQLMGADRNKSTFKGLREQWKDPSMCNCAKTHSDVVKAQLEATTDSDKPSLIKRYELDLLDQLERIVDSVETRVKRQQSRTNAAIPEFKLRSEKEKEIQELNLQMSASMKEVERLAESGLFEQSQILMQKVAELQNRVKEVSADTVSHFIKKEVVCEICGVIIGAGVDERAHDHIRGKQHMGMERVRLKINEIKSRYKLGKNQRDIDFVPSVEIQQELKREGLDLPVLQVVDDTNDTKPTKSPSPRRRSRSNDQGRRPSRHPAYPDGNDSMGPSRRRPQQQRSPSSTRSVSPISVSEDEFGRRKRRLPVFDNRRKRSPPRRNRDVHAKQRPSRTQSAGGDSPKSLASVNPDDM